MRTRHVVELFVVLGLFVPAGALAQPPVNFSGAWVRAADSTAERGPTVATVGDASFRMGDMGTGWGVGAPGGAPLTITQREDSLVIEYVFFSAYDLQPPVRLAHALDGSESRNTVMIGHATSVQRSRLSWRGNTLVITTAYRLPPEVNPRGGIIEVGQALTLELPASLVVETTRGGVAGGSTTTTRAVYTKR
jgi:hypothetical protein